MVFFNQREMMRENLFLLKMHADFPLTLLKSDFVGIEQSNESESGGAEII